jgi:hypothetical protein
MSKQTELAQVADTITVNSGKVGIGTDSPARTLEVYSSAPAIKLNNGTNAFTIGTGAFVDGSNSLVFFDEGVGERMRIDSAGRVTTPYQPAFTAKPTSFTGSGGIAGTQTFIFATALLNIGGHFNTSNGRFTAPVAGNYFFTYSITASSSSKSARYFRVRLTKNGTVIFNPHNTISDETGNADYNIVSASGLVAMNANDYVEINYGSSIDASGLVFYDSMNTFSGFLMS